MLRKGCGADGQGAVFQETEPSAQAEQTQPRTEIKQGNRAWSEGGQSAGPENSLFSFIFN